MHLKADVLGDMMKQSSTAELQETKTLQVVCCFFTAASEQKRKKMAAGRRGEGAAPAPSLPQETQ